MKPVRCPVYLSLVADYWLAKSGEARKTKAVQTRRRNRALAHKRTCGLCNTPPSGRKRRQR